MTDRKIALIGGTNTWELAPYEDESWEKWCLGNQFSFHANDRRHCINRIFEIHDDLVDQILTKYRRSGKEIPQDPEQHVKQYVESLVSYQIPMIVGRGFPLKADFIDVFPFEEAAKLLGGDYLTSSPAYMMALCCLMRLDMYPGGKVTDIALFGIDMSVDDREYFYEQPVMKEWIGFAKGIGIRIHLPKGCPLGRPNYIEGVTGSSNEGIAPFRVCDFQELIDMHDSKIDELNEEVRQINNKLEAHSGAKQAYERMLKVARARWGGQEVIMKDTVRMV